MVNWASIGTGVLFLLLAVGLYVIPVGSFGGNAFQTNALCETDLFQWGQLFHAETSQLCSTVNLMIIGTYASGIIGIVLVIVGIVKSNSSEDEIYEEKSNALDILEERYAKGEITKEEFDKMKEDLS